MSLETSTTFDDLPIHLRLFVLSFVNVDKLNQNVLRVCKDWHNLCKDPSLWRYLGFSGHSKQLHEKIRVLNSNFFVVDISFQSVHDFWWLASIKRHSSVRQIKFDDCSLIDNDVVTRLAQVFPNVKKISINNCEKVNIEFISVWRNSLKSVEIVQENEKISTCCVPIIAEKIEYLQELDLSNCPTIRRPDFQRLIELQGSHLKTLSLKVCRIWDADFAKLTQKCVNLTHLTLLNPVLMSDHGFLMLQKLKSLEFFHIYRSYRLFSTNFSVLFHSAKFAALRGVIVEECSKFDDTALTTLGNTCPNLTDLSIKGVEITNAGLECLPKVCSNLEYLMLIQVDFVTETSFRQTVDRLWKMRYCFSLQCFNINGGKLCLVVDRRTKRMFHKKSQCCLKNLPETLKNAEQ